MFLANNLFVLAGNRERVERANLRLGCVLERGDFLILIVLEVTVGQIAVEKVVFIPRFLFVNCFLEVFRLGL